MRTLLALTAALIFAGLGTTEATAQQNHSANVHVSVTIVQPLATSVAHASTSAEGVSVQWDASENSASHVESVHYVAASDDDFAPLGDAVPTDASGASLLTNSDIAGRGDLRVRRIIAVDA